MPIRTTGGAFCSAISSGVLACLLTSPSLAEIRTIDLQGGAISIGQGYDQLLDEPRGHCVTTDASFKELTRVLEEVSNAPVDAENAPENDGAALSKSPTAQQISYELRVLDVEDYRREFESLSVSASGSYGTFSASASFSSEREFERTRYNLFVVLSVDVSNVVVSGDIFSPKDKFKEGEIFELDEKECGTAFVMAVGFGGKLDLVARINTLSESERTSMRASIGGGGSFAGGGVSASASFAKMVETALERRDVHVSIKSAGPWFSDQIFGLTLTGGSFDLSEAESLKKLMNSALLFPAAVVQRPWPYLGYLVDYETIGFERQNPIAVEERRRILGDLLEAARQYDLLISRLRSAERNPDIYEVLDAGEFTPARDRLIEISEQSVLFAKRRKAIGETAARCYSDVADGSGSCIDVSEIVVEGQALTHNPSLPFGELRLVGFVDESELCSEDASFVFPQLVPASGGCVDPNTSAVWSNPHFSVEADIAQYFCTNKSKVSSREWAVPNEIDVRFLVSGALSNRADEALNSNRSQDYFPQLRATLFVG